jgi:hypothetical protein
MVVHGDRVRPSLEETVLKKLVLIAALMLAAPCTALAQQPGEWVLAQWNGGAQWFPGVVQSRNGDMVKIRYDDGTFETRPINQTRPYNWHVGTKLECRFTDGQWYGATITAASSDGLTIDVLYDDGDRQHTQTGRCRSN